MGFLEPFHPLAASLQPWNVDAIALACLFRLLLFISLPLTSPGLQ
jgi:hypothetical protein